MNLLPLLGGLAGGVGLFLLGMGLMTDGLKLAAGPALACNESYFSQKVINWDPVAMKVKKK